MVLLTLWMYPSFRNMRMRTGCDMQSKHMTCSCRYSEFMAFRCLLLPLWYGFFLFFSSFLHLFNYTASKCNFLSQLRVLSWRVFHWSGQKMVRQTTFLVCSRMRTSLHRWRVVGRVWSDIGSKVAVYGLTSALDLWCV